MSGDAELQFETHRRLLFSIAYRMTGSAADAEDLVQEAWLRFASASREDIRNVKAFLVTIVTRLALDRLKSAQAQRETYVGPWFPEPVVTQGDGDPLAVEFALLTAMERLSPQERAVLLLSDVLEHDHNEIATLLGITSASSRQILHRARERVASDRKRFTPPREEQERLIASFMAAVRDGDLDGLRNTLAADVVASGDGGGKVTGAGLRPIIGFGPVARLYMALSPRMPEWRFEVVDANGRPAVAAWEGERLYSLTLFDYEGGRIRDIMNVLNPGKLAFAERQLRSAGHRPA